MDKTDKLLQDSGATLIRKKKHLVYRLPNGRNFVRASTTSNFREQDNSYQQLKIALGMKPTGGTPGERRERKNTPGRAKALPKLFNNGLAAGLINSGVAEIALQEKTDFLEGQNLLLSEELDDIKTCFCGRVKSFFKKLWR